MRWAKGLLFTGNIVNVEDVDLYLSGVWYRAAVDFRTLHDAAYYATHIEPLLFPGKTVIIHAGARRIGEAVLEEYVYIE